MDGTELPECIADLMMNDECIQLFRGGYHTDSGIDVTPEITNALSARAIRLEPYKRDGCVAYFKIHEETRELLGVE